MGLKNRIEKLEANEPEAKTGKVIIYDTEKRDEIDLSGNKAKTVFLIPDNGRMRFSPKPLIFSKG